MIDTKHKRLNTKTVKHQVFTSADIAPGGTVNDEENPRSMNQMIFNTGLSMESISLYLLCCGLADGNTSLSVKNLMTLWNSSDESLFTSLQDLEKRNIIRKILSDRDENAIYKMTDIKDWNIAS